MSPSPSTLASVLFDSLAEHGARAVFGIPGDFAIPLFTALAEPNRLPLIPLAHEPAAAFAADAAARFSGGLGVALFTFGAGTLNALNAIANAYAEQVPLVVLSGAPSAADRSRGLLVHHQVRDCDSQRRIMAEVTVDHAVLDDPLTAPGHIARVLAACRDASRPVYLEIPRDMAHQPATHVVPLPPRASTNPGFLGAVHLLAARLRRSRAGVLIVDAGVRRFGVEDEVIAIANALGWPIATTFMGRGVLSLGRSRPPTWLGRASSAYLATAMAEADLLVGVGIIHSDTNHAGADPLLADVRYVDLNHGAIAVAPGCVLDLPLGPFMRALAGVLEADWSARPLTPRPAFRRRFRARFVPDDAPLRPDDIAPAVNELFAALDVPLPVVSDVGDCLFAVDGIAFEDLLASGYYATMGYAIPAAIGLQVVSGRRPLVFVGDGAFQMTGMELSRCASVGVDPIIVVLDNARWQMVASFDRSGAPHALPEIDYASLARALGGEACVVSTRAELAEALTVASARRGVFQLIHIRLEPGTVSAGMRRFVAAFRDRREDKRDSAA